MIPKEKSLAIAAAVIHQATLLREAVKNLKSPRKKAFKLIYNRRPLSKRRKAVAISAIVASSLSAAVQTRIILDQPKPFNHE